LETLDIEAEIIKLGLLSLELPDPNQHLYPQGDLPPQFACFPKLPIELRLVIWRFTFPASRKVNINAGQQNVFCSRDRFSKKMRLHTNQPLPMSLFICQESRIETLKHYCVYLQKQIPYSASYKSKPPYQPKCFSPTRDELFLYYDETSPRLTCRSGRPHLREHLSSLKAEASGYLAKVRQLCVEFFTPLSDKNWRLEVEILGEADTESRFAISKDFIFYFQGLQRIIFKLDIEEGWQEGGPTLKAMRALLERNKDKFEGKTAPEVVVVHRAGTWA
jgi:hypothetical protein